MPDSHIKEFAVMAQSQRAQLCGRCIYMHEIRIKIEILVQVKPKKLICNWDPAMSHLQYYTYPGFGEFVKEHTHYNQAVRVGDVIEAAGQGTNPMPSKKQKNVPHH